MTPRRRRLTRASPGVSGCCALSSGANLSRCCLPGRRGMSDRIRPICHFFPFLNSLLEFCWSCRWQSCLSALSRRHCPCRRVCNRLRAGPDSNSAAGDLAPGADGRLRMRKDCGSPAGTWWRCGCGRACTSFSRRNGWDGDRGCFSKECGITADDWHVYFALAVAAGEVLLGLSAYFLAALGRAVLRGAASWGSACPFPTGGTTTSAFGLGTWPPPLSAHGCSARIRRR